MFKDFVLALAGVLGVLGLPASAGDGFDRGKRCVRFWKGDLIETAGET
jgi:hypothetical protein